MDEALKLVFLLFPKNLFSQIFGRISRWRLPEFLLQPILKAYSRQYGVVLSEASRSLEGYHSLSDFFIRDLKPGCRPMGEGLVCPVDGRIEMHGLIEDGNLFQVKGQPYSASELLCDSALASRFAGGYYVTMYLAPGDYHQVHAPLDGKITRAIHVEGALWPVNSWSVQNIKKLFVINERVVSILETGNGLVAIVMVGATNVGSIRVAFDETLVANRRYFRSPQIYRYEYENPYAILKGGRLGTFHLGSTVILLMEAGKFVPSLPDFGSKCRMGQTLGHA